MILQTKSYRARYVQPKIVRTSHVGGLDFSSIDNVEGSGSDTVGKVVEALEETCQ